MITDAMEIKLKRQEEAEQRDQDAEDDENSVQTRIIIQFTEHRHAHARREY